MANKLTLKPEDLDFEYKMLQEELNSLDSIFNDAKERLDAVAKIPSRANPVFMASQTSNLISIKEKRLNIIKELTNIKKSKMEMEIKMFTANNKLEDQQSGVSKDILDLYRLLNKTDKVELMKNALEEPEEEIQQPEGKDLDDLLNARLNEESNEPKIIKQTLPSEYSIVCTTNKELYIIDEDYNIIEDCDFDLNKINIVKVEEEKAFDDKGNSYEVVEL